MFRPYRKKKERRTTGTLVKLREVVSLATPRKTDAAKSRRVTEENNQKSLAGQ